MMALMATERRMIGILVRDFNRLYRDDYRCNANVQIRSSPGLKTMALMLSRSEVNMREFCAVLSAHLNKARPSHEHLSVTVANADIVALLRLARGTRLISIHPKTLPSKRSLESLRAYWSRNRFFKLGPEGFVFVPFDVTTFVP
jgi:hypothetical protein